MKLCFFILLQLFNFNYLIGANFQSGDTLYVAAINGIKIRKTPGINGEILGSLLNNDTLIFIKTLANSNDSMDYFNGNWVQVYSLSRKIEGYVFDVYISKFKILKELPSLKSYIQKKNKPDRLKFELLPSILGEYVLTQFIKTNCETYYDNGDQGNGSYSIRLIPLTNNYRLIEHGYSEGGSVEFEMTDVRLADAYYIVMNLLSIMNDKTILTYEGQLKGFNLKYPKWILFATSNTEYQKERLIEINYKGNNIISIKFNFPCC